MVSYYRPQTDAAGNKLSYEQRRQIRRAQAHTPTPPVVHEVSPLSYDERRQMRRAEESGRREAGCLAETRETERKATELAATPEHLRRPENVWRKLITEWSPKSYLPDVARKIAEYERRADADDARIDAEMTERARRHAVESNPETAKAREHLATASAAADTPEERNEWARLAGLIDGGQADAYWDGAAALVSARLSRLQSRQAEEADKKAAQDAAYDAARADVDGAAGLIGE
jgi:hypothetical protein